MAYVPGKTTARIADSLRNQIVDGRWKPGDKMPTVNELIRRYAVSRTSIVHAMRVLEREGLISPEVGRGTFVRDSRLQGEIAVVLSRDLLTEQANPYYRIVASQIMAGIKDLSPRCRGRLHLASVSGQYGDRPLELDLLEDEVLSQLGGVFTFHRLFELGDQLVKRGVPIVSMSSYEQHLPCVRFDRLLGHRLALEHLRKVGARRVAVLSANLPGFPFYERWSAIERVAADVGLSVFSVPGTIGTTHGGDAEHLGQSLFNGLLDGSDRADAIFTSDEALCRGVLWAALQRGVRFPEDLLLVTFANKDVPFPTPQSVTSIEFDPVQLSMLAVDRMRRQAPAIDPGEAEDAPVLQLLQPTLRAGQSTGLRQTMSA